MQVKGEGVGDITGLDGLVVDVVNVEEGGQVVCRVLVEFGLRGACFVIVLRKFVITQDVVIMMLWERADGGINGVEDGVSKGGGVIFFLIVNAFLFALVLIVIIIIIQIITPIRWMYLGLFMGVELVHIIDIICCVDN